MDFSQKLNYLFDLSHAEGKELAAYMNITPPQISKMRRGVRGLPKNREAAETLARFFAERCSSDFQRDDLSKTLRIAQIRNVNKEGALTDILLDWLTDERNPDEYAAKRADDFLRQFGILFNSESTSETNEEKGAVFTSEQSSFYAYYGSDGKRLAMLTFLNYLRKCKEAYTINLLTDEDVGWIIDDPGYSKQMQESMLRLTEQGCTFRRIAAPIHDMDQAFISLNRWFPLYMTGKATSYYYKRMRDHLNRITIFVVPEVAVMFSFSVGGLPQQEEVTFFTVDEKTVRIMAKQFESYYALCEPIMNVYRSGGEASEMHRCMERYESCKSGCFQKNDSLSFITLPWDVAIAMQAKGNPKIKKDFLNCFVQRYKSFKSNIEQYPFVDMIRLADMKDIMAEKVSIPGVYILGDETQYYTIAGYLQHLRAVVYLLEHKANYHVVLRSEKDKDETIIYVKEGFCAILARDAAPFSTFEVSERFLIDAFTEYLRRQIPDEYDKAPYRNSVITEIRALIEKIEAEIRKQLKEAEPKVKKYKIQ